MKEYKYLDNKQRTQQTAILLAIVSSVAALVAYFMKDNQMLSWIMLAVAVVAAVIMTSLMMHYLRHNLGKTGSRVVSRALHAYMLGVVLLLGFMIVGEAGTFSYGVLHAIVDGVLVISLLLLAGCFLKNGLNKWLAILVGIVAGLLSLFSQFMWTDVVIVGAAVILFVLAIMGFSKQKAFSFGAIIYALVVGVLGVMSLLKKDGVHEFLHLGALISGLLITIFAVALVTKQVKVSDKVTDKVKDVKVGPVVPTSISDKDGVVAGNTSAGFTEKFDKEKWLDKDYRDQSYQDLVNAPVDALYGVSEGDAKLLGSAFGIKTIGDLANSKYFNWAEEINDKALNEEVVTDKKTVKDDVKKEVDKVEKTVKDEVKTTEKVIKEEVKTVKDDVKKEVNKVDKAVKDEVKTAKKDLTDSKDAADIVSKYLDANYDGPYTTPYHNKWVIKEYGKVPVEELVNCPVDALYGVSEGDAELLGKAFGIKTIGDLANSKFFNWADEINQAAED